MRARRPHIADLTTQTLQSLLTGPTPPVVLVPVGSVEPHGPHLPLGTDTIIGDAVAERAAQLLEAKGTVALVGPSVPYGVTRFAEGFAGAVTVTEAALIAFLRAVIEGYLHAGFSHVCLVSNHLEPAHDAAVRASLEGLPAGSASVASPLSRRWARTLSAEFKSGACHAGRYETSILLAAAPDTVDEARMAALPALTISLSDGIRQGKTSFLAMGITDAYTGAPAEATAEEGRDSIERLATMVVGEVEDGLAAKALRGEASRSA
ncbi:MULTISPECIES: creatininase family protein [Polyangium]|uniref:Creatininase family protein n=2 Tax=Polyangium TaxID=55 RepID=A0A4U1J1B6_9BACT|nr:MULTISPECIES: creatininase family protein [Polyangium]MDI1433705.1 creatininase family protein [Polyangium sorediatum]TKD00753.1 creatininase family protein [Polyangium fumosum]